MELFKLLGTVAIDGTKAKKELDDVSKNAGATSKEVETAVNNIGKTAGKLALGIGAAGVAAGGAWLAAIEGSREYRNEMGLLDSAFATSGHSSEVAKNTYSDLNAVMRDSGAAVEAAQHLALVADNENELNEMTHMLTGVYATFGASLPLEGLAEAINHSSALGVTQGSLADALEWSGITVEDFDEQLAKCTSEEERQDLILKTLNKTYSKAADQYKETNKDVMDAEKANEALADAFAELGRIGEPILTAIKEKVAEMVAAVSPHLQTFIDKIKDLKKWISENEDTVNTWVAVIIGAGVSISAFLLILNWGSIMAAATNAIKTLRLAMIALNTAMRANPIGLVLSLIAGLVAAFIYLWNTNENFRKFWIDLWKQIVDKAKKAKESIEKAFANIGKWFKDKFNAVRDGGKAAMDSVKKFFSDANQKVKDIWNGIGSWFKEKANSIKDGFTNAITSIPKKASDIFQKVKDAISDKIGSARDAVKKAIDKIKGFFDFKFKMPKIPIPKFSISPSGWKVGDLLKGTKPSLSIKWNAEGGIIDQPTIFGMTASGQMLGGGEAGKEAIAPITLLQDYVKNAVMAENDGIRATIIEQNERLMALIERIMPSGIKLDTGALVGEITPSIDMLLADRWNHSKRGNTR